MIELRKHLYESLLDDEEDLVEDETTLKELVFDKVYSKYMPISQIDQYVGVDGDKVDMKVAFFHDTNKEGFEWIMSGDIVTDFSHIHLLNNTDVIEKVNHNKLNIDDLGQLITDEDFLSHMDKYLNIKQINMLNIQLWDAKNNWNKVFKDTTVKNAWITGGSLYSNERDKNTETLIHSIKGFNGDIMILSCRLFLDITQYSNRIEYEQTYRNTSLLDYIFDNNKFKILLIQNEQGYKRKYIKVEQSKRSESGYKFTRSNWSW